MSDKPVAVVTGASQGLGLETCRQLESLGYRVVLTARTEAAVEAGVSASGDASVIGHVLDPASDESVADFLQWLQGESTRLDVLVNNAGRIYPGEGGRPPSATQLLTAIDNNAMGPWRLTLACLPLLAKSPSARIVNVSSGMGALTDMGGGSNAYRISKAALNVVTRLIYNHVPPTVKVNAVCPGWVRTDMGGPNAERDVKQGAASIVWAVTIPDDGPSGGFFRDGEALDW